MVQAGLRAIYVSGWQVAADNNSSGQVYPDQSLYPSNSVPNLVKSINNSFRRADQIQWSEAKNITDYFAPIIADGEAGFGGVLNAFELTKSLIESGAAGVHFEDQLSSEKKCGHLGGKVLVPTSQFIKTLKSARLASDVLDIPTLIIARTDAESAYLLTSDVDVRDKQFLTGKRTSEGYYKAVGGVEMAISRGLAYAPYSDLIWCETSTPDLKEAEKFSEGIHKHFPNKMLAYNCSPSFNWAKYDGNLAKFQKELGLMGYKFQFITLAGFHSLNEAMYTLAWDYAKRGMEAYATLQGIEFDLYDNSSYKAIKHQSFVGTGYFDKVSECISNGETSTASLPNSTEQTQFPKS